MSSRAVPDSRTEPHGATPWGDINSAMTMAAINGGLEVWVAQGTYYGNTTGDNAFSMLEGVNLYGAFTGTETDFSQRPSFNSTTQQLNNSTILDGANSRRVLKQKYNFDTLTVWDGFTLQNGFVINNVGAAAVLKGGSQLRNCIIQNNINYFTTSNNRYGGAIKIEGSYADTTLWGCTVRNNYSQGQDGSTPYVYGYALYAGRTNIVNCLFYDNRGYDAAVNLNNNAQMFNSVISNNQGNYCAGMNLGSGTSVYNCVVAQNVSEHGYGGVKGNGSLYNSIIWGNKQNYTANNLSNYLNLYNCAVEGGYEDGTNVMTLAATNDGTSGSLNYVRFIDPTQNVFRLHPASHCLDQGDTSFTHLGYALDGSARILGAAMDLGAYESETSATCPSPINMRCSSLSGTTATFAWTPLGSESQWRFTITGASDGLDSTITVSDTTLSVGNLRLNHTYTAYVRAICSSEYSAHSPQVTLSTLCDSTTLTPLSAFSGMYPADSSIVVGQRASFSWDNVPDATSYDFYIWRDDQSVPDEPTATGITLDGVSNILIPNYKQGCFYHWKVVAWNQCIKRSSAVQTIELDPLPDLHVTNVTFSQPIANQPLTVTWTVRNDGRGATPQEATWYDRIWIVSDVDVRLYDTHDNEGRIPDCENLQGLAPGESYTNSQTFIVPRGLIGNYYIFVFADQTDAYNINFSETGGIAPDPYTPSVTGNPYHYLKGSVHQGGNIPEVEDNDNFFYKSFYIMPPPAPDLTVTHIGHPTQAFSYSDITVMWTVSNVGDAQAGGRSKWFDDIYIQMGDELNMAEAVRLARVKHWAGEDSCYQVCHACPSDNPNCNPCHIECWPKGIALQPDSSYTVSKTVRIPIQFAGEYSIFVVTDATHTIYESIYETNNTVLSEQHINVIMTPLADLQVSNVEILDSVVSGQPFRLAYSVTNISSTLIDSLSWNDKITLSDVNGYTSWSMQLSLYPRVKYLDSGWFYRDTVTVTIPVPYQGSRFLLIHANAQNTFYEADQTNNVVAVPVNITLPPPGDLTVTNITHSDSVLTGTSTTVRWNVKNIGNNSISGQRLSSLVYLSRDNIFSSDDKLLGTINSTSVNLAPGDSVVQQASVMISGQGEGNRYFIVKTDVRNAFHEDDENNNTVAAAEPIFVMLRELPFNTTVTDTLYATRILDYKLDVGTHHNETVRISLETADSLNGAVNNIYVAYNTVGNSLSSTYSSFEQYAANPEVFIPSTRTGYYGVSIEGSTPSRQPQVVQLRADILPFELRSINPTYGGNNGMVTIELNGSRFRPDMDVWMEKGGDTLRPVDLNFVSYYQAYARFNLSGADTGDYNIGLFNFCEGEVSMDSAFHISAPSPDGLGYNIIFPNSPRPNRTITMVLEFGNLGNTDIENVVLEVESVGGTYISLTPEGLREHGTTVQIPLNIPGEPEGLLRPGIHGTVTFYGYTAGSIVFVTRRVEE